MKQIVKDSVLIEKEIFISSSSEALFKKYAKSCQIKISSDCEALCGTFPKNVARIECATHHERLYNACIWLKKIQFAKNFLKMPKIHLDHFQNRILVANLIPSAIFCDRPKTKLFFKLL